MRTALSSLELVSPQSLDDALRLLADAQEPLRPAAGCTDLYVQANAGQLTARRFLDLSDLAELRRIELSGGVLTIGATVTYAELQRSRLVARHLPMLAEAARQVGGPQVQNRGTLGGNVAHGSPAGDSLPVLAAAEAVVVLRCATIERRVPFDAFYTGYRRSVLRPDELIVAFEIPPVEGRQWFRKVGARRAQTISKVVMAAVRGPAVRIALGSVAPTVVRCHEAEALLSAGGTLEEAEPTMVWEISPIDDLRSTAAYRRQVAANLLAAFWRETGSRKKTAARRSSRPSARSHRSPT